MTRSLTLPFLAVALLALTGCNPYLYINIPPQAGDLARSNANDKIVREVEAESLRYLLAARPLPSPVALKLPAGSTELTIADVARRSGDVVVPLREGEAAVSVIEVSQVRLRGVFAEVDMMYPTVAGMQQLLTVYLEYKPMSDWVVERVSDWPGATHPIDHGGLVTP